MEFLKELPPVCRSTLANMLTHQAAHMLDSRCGTDVGLSGSMVPGAPKASPARTPIVIPRLTYQPSKECSDRYDDGMIKYIYDTSRFCNKYTERVGCLKQCAAYLKISILPECAQTVFLHPRYGSDIAGWYVRRCHLPLPDDDSPSPSPGTPPQGLAPPLPVELSPSPSPSPTSQLPPEVLPPLDSPAPAPAASGLLVPSDFACEGEYSWISLNPSQASQWGEAAPETGAPAALAGKCSSLHTGNEQTHSGCCSETREDMYPWWQYDLGSERQVKGVRLKPAQDITCCLDAACTQPGPCFERLEPSYISVGSLSLPRFYASQNYTDLLASVGGNATQAQPGVLAALEAGSAVCNAVAAVNLVDSTNKAVDYVSLGCSANLANGSPPTPTTGRYVTIIQDTIVPESLALCGIQICATS